MVRYILRTVYNSVFDMMILLGEAVTNLLRLRSIMLHLNTKFVIMPDWPFFGCILYVFSEGSNIVIVSGRLANLTMISEEHWKMIK